jgi:glucose/arabinose dehydrogenase
MRNLRAATPGALLLGLLVILVGCAGDGIQGVTPASVGPPAAAEPTRPGRGANVRLTKLAQFPTLLTSFDATPDGSALLVGDRQGVVWRLVRVRRDGVTVPQLDPQPILDLSAEVSLLGERGSFDLKLTPDGDAFLVNYTAEDGTITIERFPYPADGSVDRSRGQVLVALPHPYSWHHGGGMAFAEDGDLYVGVGDMEYRQTAPPGPQDPSLLLGGILRVPSAAVVDPDVSWEPVPGDLVARGLRNPWRITIDPQTGDLWIGDVGLKAIEEIDVISRDRLDEEVVNFGWPYLEGSIENQKGMPPGLEVEAPVLEREHTPTTCGVVGGYRYRGQLIPGLQGAVVYGDLCGDALRVLEVDDAFRVVDDGELIAVEEPIISLGRDHRGELYLLGVAGGLYRLDPADWDVRSSLQEADAVAAPPTTVPRTLQTCDGLVGVLEPLSDLGSMDAAEAEAALALANAQFDEVVPLLPPTIYEDGLLVRETFRQLAEELTEIGWNSQSPEFQALSEEARTGTGRFDGMPDALARIVDSECG